jgi:hypothetical protein
MIAGPGSVAAIDVQATSEPAKAPMA